MARFNCAPKRDAAMVSNKKNTASNLGSEQIGVTTYGHTMAASVCASFANQATKQTGRLSTNRASASSRAL